MKGNPTDSSTYSLTECGFHPSPTWRQKSLSRSWGLEGPSGSRRPSLGTIPFPPRFSKTGSRSPSPTQTSQRPGDISTDLGTG